MDSFICFDAYPVYDFDFLNQLELSNDYLTGEDYQLVPLACTFFHRLRADSFVQDLNHIINLLVKTDAVGG
jgi:hypothetical protein